MEITGFLLLCGKCRGEGGGTQQLTSGCQLLCKILPNLQLLHISIAKNAGDIKCHVEYRVMTSY